VAQERQHHADAAICIAAAAVYQLQHNWSQQASTKAMELYLFNTQNSADHASNNATCCDICSSHPTRTPIAADHPNKTANHSHDEVTATDYSL
jgi:hypothetical protein